MLFPTALMQWLKQAAGIAIVTLALAAACFTLSVELNGCYTNNS
jgi:hypothetical protein